MLSIDNIQLLHSTTINDGKSEMHANIIMQINIACKIVHVLLLSIYGWIALLFISPTTNLMIVSYFS